MLLRVEKLGPIEEAELDLSRPLIVLAGPNNSGKTYLTWVAYSLAKLDWNKVTVPSEVISWVDRLFATESFSLPTASLLSLNEPILATGADALLKQLPETFAAPRNRFESTQIRLLAAPRGIYSRYSRAFSIATFEGHLIPILEARGSGKTLELVLHTRDSLAHEISPASLDKQSAETLEKIRPSVARLAIASATSQLLDRGYTALPVERLAINLFAKELAANRTELVDSLLSDASNSDDIDLRDELRRRASRYPLVIRDALDSAIRSPLTRETGPLAELADELEQTVLQGRITKSIRDELEFVPRADDKGQALGLHQSASVVKSLVSLVLYLRYEAAPGERLIIDEPELNLHPDNQRRVARILAKAVNQGLKVMMSTHSDYVIRELNNLVMLGQGSADSKALMDELGYDESETLQADQIGAYLVSDGQCRSLPVSETGFEVVTIEEEIHRLNRDSQLIYQRLFCEE